MLNLIIILLILSCSNEKLNSTKIHKIKLDENRIQFKTDRSKLFYLQNELDSQEFEQIKKKEIIEFSKDVNSGFQNQKFEFTYTGYFNIAHTCDTTKKDKLIRNLEIFFRDTYPLYFQWEPNFPIRLVLFPDRKTLKKETGMDVYGFYIPNSRESYPNITTKTIYTYCISGSGTQWHEVMHAFLDWNAKEYPPSWFSEGIASFYEEASIIDGKMVDGYVNWRNPTLIAEIKSKKNYSTLTEIIKGKDTSRESFYAQARFLFCYLWMKGKIVPFVRTYLYDIHPKFDYKERGLKTILLLEELLGKSIDEIEIDFQKEALIAGPKMKKLKLK
ncbi:MAG: hypothetical protein SFU98_19850 [Leptospiraceae bacterium]|nr:hypothetical protein [Leptospiraceae bacterium]